MIRQTLFAGLFAVTGFATAPVANADAAGEALVRDALNAISSAPGWTATSDVVRSEGDRVLVEGLSIGHSGYDFALSADKITLSRLSRRGSDYFTSAMTVTDLSVAYDLASLLPSKDTDAGQGAASLSTHVRIETLGVIDLRLPSQAGPAPDQPGFLSGLIGLYSYLADVELASLNVPVANLEQSVAMPDDKRQTTQTTYNDVRISNWSNGIIERYDLGRLGIRVSGGPQGDLEMGADGALVEHLDLGHNAHVLDPAQYAGGRGDGVWKPLMKRAEYRGFRINTKDVNVSMARLGMTGLDARQTETPMLPQIEKLIAISLSGREPSEAESLEIVSELLPNIFRFFRIGEFAMEGLKVTPVVSSRQASASLDLMRMVGFSSFGIDRFSIEGLSATGPDNSGFSLASFGFEELGFPDSELLMEFAEAAQRGEDIGENPQLMSKVLDLYPTIEAISMRDLTGNAPGKEPFRIDEVSFEVTARMNALMASGRAVVRGFVFPASYFDQGGPNPLRMLNYDRLALDFVSESVWDEDTSDLDYRADLLVEDVGGLVLEYGMTGITEESVRRLFNDIIALQASGGGDDPAQVLALLEELGFTGFSISFSDRSIVGRGMTMAASKQGVDARTYRDQMKSALPFLMSSMPPGDFRQQVIAAAQAALDGGQKTTFSLKPARALSVSEIFAAGMQDPLSLIGLLGASMMSEPVN